MLHVFLTVLFWLYWCITAACVLLILRELFRAKDWKLQATAALAIIPLLLRAFLLK